MNKFIMQQAKQMGAKLAKIQEELANTTMEVSSGGGMVTVTISGDQKIQSIKIAPEAVDPEDVGMLEDMVLAAINEAIAKSQETARERLGDLTGGMHIPGLF